MKRLLACLVITLALTACGSTDAATRATNLGAATLFPSAAPGAARVATATSTQARNVELPRTVTIPTPNSPGASVAPGFRRYTADQVIAALQAAGLSISDVKAAPRDPNALAPDVAAETKTFAIASIAPRGGQVLSFNEPHDLQEMQAWFARFPDLAPYVYIRDNVMVQLHTSLPQAEAERFKVALEAMR
jgi:hypothetical protein